MTIKMKKKKLNLKFFNLPIPYCRTENNGLRYFSVWAVVLNIPNILENIFL